MRPIGSTEPSTPSQKGTASPYRHGRLTPAAAGSALGRADEIAELEQLLATSPLITLTGAPGIGKTTLALELAAVYRGSAHVVELASLTLPTHVPRAFASALSVEEVAGERLTDTLVARLGQRRRLVVLDNCEHLLGAAAELVGALLSGCPKLRLLVTSREALGLEAEQVWQVSALTVPEAGEATPEVLARYPAVGLLLERASAVQPDFSLNSYLAPAVAEICRRLEGIPLAIELAAARVESLTPGEIARRLDDRFGLLVKGSPGAPSRHRTLEAALDWSHDLLTAGERALLRRLAVFAESFEVEAATSVCSYTEVEGSEVEPEKVPDLLSALVSKSLVLADATPVGPRYRLLETIRAYAAHRLEEAGEAPRVRGAHARHFLGLAERAEHELTGSDQGRWFERLETEHSNLRSAIEWSVSHGEAEWALRLAGALVLFWRVRCHFSAGRELLEAALSASNGTSSAFRAKALWGTGLMALMGGDIDGAVPALEESIARCDETGDRQVRARALLSLGDCGGYKGDPQTLSLLEQSAALARETPDPWCLAHALGVAACEHNYRDNLPAARALFEECLAVAREAEDTQSLLYGLIGLGMVCVRQGNYRSAEPLLEEAAIVTGELGDDYGMATVLQYLGDLALGRGEHERARRLLEEALALMPELGPPAARFGPLVYLAQVARAEGDRSRARLVLERALALVPTGVDTPVAALLGMAELAAAEGDVRAAHRLYDEALDSARAERGGGGEDTAGALYGLADLSRAEGDVKRAAVLHHEALELRREIGSVPTIAASLEALAGLDPAAGGYEHSARLFGAAQALRETEGYARSPRDSSRHEADTTLLLESLGADGFRDSVAQGAALSMDEAIYEALKRRGRRGRPPNGWSSLTQSEQQVAALAAEGLTNPEIAGRLAISLGTVKTHLSHVFQKLGVTGRTGLARVVERRDWQHLKADQ